MQKKDLDEVARDKVPLVKNLAEFCSLKPTQQAHILAGFIRIYRKGGKVGGD